MTLTWSKTLLTKNTLIFQINSQLNLNKNASNRRKVQICNEANLFFP